MSIRRSFAALLLLCPGAVCAPVRAQSPAPAPPVSTFEVATIKPSPPFDPAKMQAMMQAGKMPRFGPHVDASQAEYIYMSLKDLIGNAYSLKAYQITGPDWLNGQRFDIAAKLPDAARPADAPAMLQALLAERFKLTVHRESQEHPVMALIVAKGGPKMKKSAAPEGFDESTPLKDRETSIETPDGPVRVAMSPAGATMNMGTKGRLTQRFDAQAQSIRMEAAGVTMQGLAALLSNGMLPGMNGPRQVIDATGLTAHYDFTLEIPLAGMRMNGQNAGPGGAGGGDNGVLAASDPSGGPAGVLASLQALGLKVENRKATVEQLIVDHAEKAPTEN